MGNSLSKKTLRTVYARRAAAFTLAELIVSVAILALMLTLAGQVFSVSSRSTGQATALTNVTQTLRTLEKTLRDDFRHVSRQTSILLIESNPVNAYLTRAGLEADRGADGRLGDPSDGYPHPADPEREVSEPPPNVLDIPLNSPRADLVMFISANGASSIRSPGTHATAQQVVVGHADIADWKMGADGNTLTRVFPDFPDLLEDNTVFSVPAQDWHLFRRSLLLSEASSPEGVNEDTGQAEAIWAESLSDADDLPDILNGRKDVVADFDYERLVLELHSLDDDDTPPYLPAVLPLNDPVPARSLLDLAPPPGIDGALGHYFLPNCASFKVEWALDPASEFVGGRLDGETEVYWIDMGRLPPDGDVRKGAFKDIYDAAARAEAADPPDTARANRLLELVEGLRGREGGNDYSLKDRFQDTENWNVYPGQQHPNLAVFKPKTRREREGNAANSLSDDPIFPKALRITVDVFDDARRLERPIRHVMVIPIG